MRRWICALWIKTKIFFNNSFLYVSYQTCYLPWFWPWSNSLVECACKTLLSKAGKMIGIIGGRGRNTTMNASNIIYKFFILPYSVWVCGKKVNIETVESLQMYEAARYWTRDCHGSPVLGAFSFLQSFLASEASFCSQHLAFLIHSIVVLLNCKLF